MRKIGTIGIGFAIVITFVVGAEITYGQKSDIWSPVPSEQRDLLKSRFSEFVRAHKEKDWSKVFDYLGSQYKNSSAVPYTKAEFINKKLYSRAKKFTVRSAQKMDEGWWMIWGCASFPTDGNMEAALEAYFEEGNWYFSDIWSSPPCIDCKPKSCKH